LHVPNIHDHGDSGHSRSTNLREAAFEFVEADTTTEALERIREAQPGVIVLDVRTPNAAGAEVARIDRSDVAFSLIQLVQLTSASAAQAVQDATLEGGADHYLKYPPSPEALIGIVAAGIAAPCRNLKLSPKPRIGPQTNVSVLLSRCTGT
jgi:CheY-like chemotaxis protein